MKILIFGNLASGKSYLARKILETIPNLEYLSIDDFRKQFGNGTMEKELLAKQKFFNSFNLDKLQLIEATGLGDTGEVIAKKLQQTEEFKFIIILRTPLEICLERLKTRIYDVPYPALPEESQKLAEITDELLATNAVQILWRNAINSNIIELRRFSDHKIRQIIQTIKSRLQK